MATNVPRLETITLGFAVLILFASTILFTILSAQAAERTDQLPQEDYNHAKFAPKADIFRTFRSFAVSFDSNDEDFGLRQRTSFIG